MSENEKYICLINEEEQYSLWLSNKKIPLGWQQVGIEGEKHFILEYIDKSWKDLRPKILREKMLSNK